MKDGKFESGDLDGIHFMNDLAGALGPTRREVIERVNSLLPAIKQAWLEDLRKSGVVVGHNKNEYAKGEWQDCEAEPYPEGWTHSGLLIDVREL